MGPARHTIPGEKLRPELHSSGPGNGNPARMAQLGRREGPGLGLCTACHSAPDRLQAARGCVTHIRSLPPTLPSWGRVYGSAVLAIVWVRVYP